MTVPNCPVLFAGRDSNAYVVRVIGRGTLRESPTLQAFGQQCLDDSAAELEIDLGQCEYLDSSFLGTLVALHRYAQSPLRLRILADEPTRRRLLASARLDRLLNCLATGRALAPTQFVPLETRALSLEETARHALRAHRRLAELDGDDADAFGRVADCLQHELEERGQASDCQTTGKGG